ncbi:hypothetical protein PSTEL_09575 [Paenibacillus stellifer]|uniref:Uncharacterized protein n=1 Tax=Paenibacillus stellifer TaxID=169760 RepID=A0A089N3L5_9BACL|nr:hypothetical protein PSTEL_09575 [Paenibacillus stellifer]
MFFFFEDDPASRLAALFYPSRILGWVHTYSWGWGDVDYAVVVESSDGMYVHHATLGQQDRQECIARNDFTPSSLDYYNRKGWVWSSEEDKLRVYEAARRNHADDLRKIHFDSNHRAAMRKGNRHGKRQA